MLPHTARLAAILAVALGLAPACATHYPGSSATTPPATRAALRLDSLNAVVWVQSAVEYEATALQAFRFAQTQLDRALGDPRWTAALEQTGEEVSGLPPAVILDVDETTLDNSYYQARLIRDDMAFDPAAWDAWCEEARATAIPGALEFAQHAARQGVTVFYITNRTANLEAATRSNLAALGFPLDERIDTVLTRGERPEWQASAKTGRRSHAAQAHRVLLLVGDDLGDFIDASGSPEERQARTAPHAAWWGQRWIMLPNPMYGSWEGAITAGAVDPVDAKRWSLRLAVGDPER